MKLQQGQIWKQEQQFLRIVKLERLAVQYKAMRDPTTKEGTVHQLTKKEFCRLLKKAVLVEPEKSPAAGEG